MDEILIFSILLWVASLVICIVLFCAAYKDKDKRERAFLIAEACIWLLLFLLLPIVLTEENELLTGAVEIFLFGIFMLLLAWQYASRVKKCNYEVNAKCTGYWEIMGNRGHRRYAPEFQYRYQKTDYKEYSFRTYSLRKFEKLFELHKQYTIFIDPNSPQRCIDKRIRLDGGIICIRVLGVLFILLSIVAFTNAIE